jgi:histidinol dehydrogenase
MKLFTYPSKSEWFSIIKRPVIEAAKIESIVMDIIQDVQLNGDQALYNYAEKFDGYRPENITVSEVEINSSYTLINEELKKAIDIAYQNILTFHSAQKEIFSPIETMPGVRCWRKSIAIEKVGLYIPGGSAPLFSTILMLATPAIIAGCKEIVLCTPSNTEGKIHPAILYTAHKVGITKIIKAGGAQAIAAMTFGTDSVPKVYKIFGPGNQYVTTAKQLVTKYGVAIDMPAGPSEVAVIADEEANAAFVASDLLSQAEHGADSQVLLVSTSESKINEVQIELEKQLNQLSRKEVASKALLNSKAILLSNANDVMELINLYAPEHLILQVKNTDEYINKVVNAGSVFIGPYTPESAGDYASGTNHTLPTNGYATAYAGVSLDSFIRKVTFQEITPEGLKNIGPAIEHMAAAETLDAHKNAVTIRLNSLK